MGPELIGAQPAGLVDSEEGVALLVARADEGRLAIRRGQKAIDQLLVSLLGSRD